jgi:CRISPR-associated protein Cmr1
MYGLGDTPELRPSAFKGMMRFWWRALKADPDVRRLRKEEAEIFGGVGEGEGKSMVCLHISAKNVVIKKDLRSACRLSWNFDQSKRTVSGPHEGIAYLLYSVATGKKYIDAGSSFAVTLGSEDQSALEQATTALWAALYLGGFGLRSRRGGGNIQVVELRKPEELTGIPDFRLSGGDPSQWLCQNLRTAREKLGAQDTKAAKYSHLSGCEFLVSKNPCRYWFEALNEVGKLYKSFREKHRDKFFESAIFGLPVVHRSGVVKPENQNYGRRASPLVFKVLEIPKKGFFWMALRFSGDFLPDGGKVKMGDRKGTVGRQMLDDFWKELGSMV